MTTFNDIVKLTEKYYSMEEPDTFCIYCQRECVSHANLRVHLHREHPGSYADHALNPPEES